MCEKVAYATSRAARAGLHNARRVARIKGNRRMPVRVYLCDCGKWHLTSVTERERRLS
jgi:hypothetical protein